MESITKKNIADLVALQTVRGRAQQQRCIVEGIRAISTFISAGYQPIACYVTLQAQEQLQYPHTLVTEQVMRRMSAAKTPSGVLCVFAIPAPQIPKKLSGLVLAGVSDPGNMGTLIRTARALNVPDIIIVEGADPWSPKVIQASAGTIALRPPLQLSWPALVNLKKEVPLCALVVTGGLPPEKIDIKPLLLVVGNEAHGLPQAWQDACEIHLTLPMPGGTESLNAAVAGAIALYVTKDCYANTP